MGLFAWCVPEPAKANLAEHEQTSESAPMRCPSHELQTHANRVECVVPLPLPHALTWAKLACSRFTLRARCAASAFQSLMLCENALHISLQLLPVCLGCLAHCEPLRRDEHIHNAIDPEEGRRKRIVTRSRRIRPRRVAHSRHASKSRSRHTLERVWVGSFVKGEGHGCESVRARFGQVRSN